MPTLSIIIPTLNEAERLESTLDAVRPVLQMLAADILVVDGGSRDGTPERAVSLGARVLFAPRGRAVQMNAGADAATGDYLLFLHADTWLTGPAIQALVACLVADPVWGRFDVRLSGVHPLLRIVEWSMNLRSRWTGIATGDQALFVRRHFFERVGGFPSIPLMEDIALSRILKAHAAPTCLRERVITSSRKWEREGICRTIVRMWWLRLRYVLGADPTRLAAAYYHPS